MEGRDRASRGHHQQRCTCRYAQMSYDSDTTVIMSTECYIECGKMLPTTNTLQCVLKDKDIANKRS